MVVVLKVDVGVQKGTVNGHISNRGLTWCRHKLTRLTSLRGERKGGGVCLEFASLVLRADDFERRFFHDGSTLTLYRWIIWIVSTEGGSFRSVPPQPQSCPGGSRLIS